MIDLKSNIQCRVAGGKKKQGFERDTRPIPTDPTAAGGIGLLGL
jgi:hypothetical protein